MRATITRSVPLGRLPLDGGRGRWLARRRIDERLNLAAQIDERFDVLRLRGDRDDVLLFIGRLVALEQKDAGDLLAVDEVTDEAEELGLAELAVVDDVAVVGGRFDLQPAVDDRAGSDRNGRGHQRRPDCQCHQDFTHVCLPTPIQQETCYSTTWMIFRWPSLSSTYAVTLRSRAMPANSETCVFLIFSFSPRLSSMVFTGRCASSR